MPTGMLTPGSAPPARPGRRDTAGGVSAAGRQVALVVVIQVVVQRGVAGDHVHGRLLRARRAPVDSDVVSDQVGLKVRPGPGILGDQAPGSLVGAVTGIALRVLVSGRLVGE